MAGGGAMKQETLVDLHVFEDHLARYAFASEFVKNENVLDVACGAGYGSSYLFKRGAKSVVGGEISINDVKTAQEVYGSKGVQFVALDATLLPFENEVFDAVISMETIEHLARYKDYLSECKRVLKKGGVYICSTPNKGHGIPEIKSFSPYHVHEFYIEELKNLISEYFTDVSLYGQDT